MPKTETIEGTDNEKLNHDNTTTTGGAAGQNVMSTEKKKFSILKLCLGIAVVGAVGAGAWYLLKGGRVEMVATPA